MAKETTFDHPPRGHVAILAYDSANDRWQAVYVDASGNLQVDIAAAEAIDTHPHGYISSDWQKLAMLWGYSAVTSELLEDDDADEGLNQLDTTAVPSGEIHVIHTLYGVNVNTNPTFILMSLVRNSDTYFLKRVASPGAGTSVELTGTIVMEEGDFLRCAIQGCTLNDNIRFAITGYKMDIDL